MNFIESINLNFVSYEGGAPLCPSCPHCGLLHTNYWGVVMFLFYLFGILVMGGGVGVVGGVEEIMTTEALLISLRSSQYLWYYL